MTNVAPLIFKWKYNGIELPEEFDSNKYEPEENVFEVSDYLAQAEEVYCTYVFHKSVNNELFHDLFYSLKELYNCTIPLNEEMLACVACLKSAYAEIVQYNDNYFNEVRTTLKRLENNKEKSNERKKWYVEQLQKTSQSMQCFMLFCTFVENLNDGIAEFEKTGNVDKIEKSIVSLRKKIQSSADFLVRKMSGIWKRNLWKTIEKTRSYAKIAMLNKKLQSLIAKSKSDLNDINAIKKGYKKYFYDVEPQGCYALCAVGNQNYFALSGYDYASSGTPPTNNNDVDVVAKAIGLSLKGFKRAVLNDKVKRYATYVSAKQIVFDGVENEYGNELLMENSFLAQNYSCCERKILSIIPNSEKDISFFIRFKPCKRCLPAMIDKKDRHIESYVISEQNGYGQKYFMSKVLVKDDSYSVGNYTIPCYELSESIIVD